MKRRLHRVLIAVASMLLGAGAVVLGTAAPASAVLEGTVTPAEVEGSINDAPMFSSVSVSAGCPEHYDKRVSILVVGANGSESIMGGYYSPPEGQSLREPFTFVPPTTTRPSLSAALRGTVPDGPYQLRVRCMAANGDAAHPVMPELHFAFTVQVTGDRWELVRADPEETELSLTADPAGQVETTRDFTLRATVTPAGAEGKVLFRRSVGASPSEATVENGVATLSDRAAASPNLTNWTAEFVPGDPTEFAGSTATLPYYTVNELTMEVRNAEGNLFEDEPDLAAGQELSVTAHGYRPDEAVAFAVSGSDAEFGGATAAEGSVTEHKLTLPEDLEAGDYTLTATGADSERENSFPFTVAGGDDDDVPGDDDDNPNGGGGDDDDNNTNGGGGDDDDTGATGSTGTSGTTGSSGTTGGYSSGSSLGTSGGGGSSGPLASTGAGVAGIGAFAALLTAGGAFVVYRAHRAGRLRSFGPAARP